MKTLLLVRIAVRSILKNKMRTLLTMLGIIIGVAAVIVMVAVGQGARLQIQQRIDKLGSNLVVVTPGASRSGGVNMGAGSSNRLTLDDYEALKRESMWLSSISRGAGPCGGRFRQLARGGDGRVHGLFTHPQLECLQWPSLR
jgi:putative ABC transport system permease protein